MIDSVIDLNNVGVAYLEAGDIDRAKICFKKALDQITALLQSKQPSDTSSYTDIHVSPNTSHVISTATSIPGWIPSKRLDHNVGSYVCSQAHNVSKECFNHLCSEAFCHRESMVITFNLALAHHLSGIALHTTKSLVVALKLYEVSLSLLRGHTGFEACYIHLALLNNMGQIHYELAEYDKAATCFTSLKQLLASDAVVVLESGVLSGFFMNLMFLDYPRNAAAA